MRKQINEKTSAIQLYNLARVVSFHPLPTLQEGAHGQEPRTLVWAWNNAPPRWHKMRARPARRLAQIPGFGCCCCRSPLLKMALPARPARCDATRRADLFSVPRRGGSGPFFMFCFLSPTHLSTSCAARQALRETELGIGPTPPCASCPRPLAQIQRNTSEGPRDQTRGGFVAFHSAAVNRRTGTVRLARSEKTGTPTLLIVHRAEPLRCVVCRDPSGRLHSFAAHPGRPNARSTRSFVSMKHSFQQLANAFSSFSLEPASKSYSCSQTPPQHSVVVLVEDGSARLGEKPCRRGPMFNGTETISLSGNSGR
jgi:hypothetical protein